MKKSLLVLILILLMETLPLMASVQSAKLWSKPWTLSYGAPDVLWTGYDSTQTMKAAAQEGLNTRSRNNGYPAFKDPGTSNIFGMPSLNDSDWVDNGSAELVIGLNDAEQNHYSDLIDLIANSRGKLVETLLVGKKVSALVVKVPVSSVSNLVSETRLSKWARYVEPNVKMRADFTPNDPYWLNQWGPAKIQADFAWNTTMGSASIIVAVVDTGVDWSHPDLAPNYVPLGYDWVNNNPDPMDDNGHGTHVAGIIAAAINNSVGIAGLANVRIMAEKVLDKDGSGTTSDVAQGIIHAVDSGAKIINLSLGATYPSEVLYEAVRYAFEHGVLVVASAGNSASSVKEYPAGYDEVVAVSATTMSDSLASFSNYGNWIDVAAPGVHIYSTIINDSYAYLSGTSMASPHAAGVAALIWSRFPNMTRDQVWAQLQYTADDLGTPGFDIYYGFGRIDAKKAVEQVPMNHDLLVLRMRGPSFVQLDTEATVNTTVLNMGNSNESGVTVELLVNGTVANSSAIGLLESGASEIVSLSWNGTVEGVYNVTAYVLPVAGETSIENNAFSTQVLCKSPQIIRVPSDYGTIQGAVNAANEGDTILVASGTYHENVQIVTSGLTIIGENKTSTVIDGGGKGNVVSVTADKVEIDGFTIQNGGKDNVGISLLGSDANTINNTVIIGNTYGLFLDTSPSTTARNNAITNNTFNFGLYGESLMDFIQDIDSSNTVAGKPICYIVNQTGSSVPTDAGYVAVVNSTDINVMDANLTGNYEGVLFAYSSWSVVQNVNASNNSVDVFLYESLNNSVTDTLLTNSDEGIYLLSSDNNTIASSNLSNNTYGLDIARSYNNAMNDLEVFNNTYGVLLEMSGNNSLRNNNMTINQFNFGVVGTQLSALVNDVDTSNIVDGKPVYYLVNQHDEQIPKDAGYVAVVNCANITVAQLNVTKNVQGVLLAFTTDSTISQSNLTANDQNGIIFCSSDQNRIYSNKLAGNSVGISTVDSINNTIYHNNFMGDNVEALCTNSSDLWDNGYRSGGNYWINFTELDSRRGVYQNETGSDGIGDTPYVIDSHNKDNYPLMQPWTGHDITVISATSTKTVIGKGFSYEVIVNVANDGDTAETVNITAYANATVIGTQQITNLNGTEQDVLTFDQNTTGLAYGNYTISAYASPVPGETNIANNNVTADSIYVGIPGDINGDGTVNILDAIQVSNSFLATPVSSNWNSNADINGDGTVNILDAIIMGNHFLQHYP
ncbi:MAG: S8 family serine peptidase [Candidatus Bathyarchaeia archaeon]